MPHAIETAATPPASRERLTLWMLAAGALVVVAAFLRVVSAEGDLWLDEIWSLSLIEEAGSPQSILFGINHDNNHYLNSLWLYLVGAEAPVLLQRGLSIVMGAATVVAAGLVFGRDRTAQMILMLIAAVAAALVNHGSEARGYAGLALFVFLAFAIAVRLIEGADARMRAGLAVVTGLGLLSHLTFVIALGVAGLWLAIETWRSGSIRAAERATLKAFTPALAVALMIGLCIVAGALESGFRIGGVTPFSYERFVEGYGGLLRAMIGLPKEMPAGLLLIIVGAGLTAALLHPKLINRRFAPLYAVGLVLVPAAMVLARLPNTGFSRYFLVSGVVFAIFLADLIAHALRGGLVLRTAAVFGLMGMIAGNIATVAANHDGRGRYSEAVALMSEGGAFTYGSDSAFRTGMAIAYHARLLGVNATLVPIDAWCATPPDWLVLERAAETEKKGFGRVSAAPGCSLGVTQAATFPAPTGIAWTLYRIHSKTP